MEQAKRKFPLSVFEVVFLVVITPFIFYCWTKLLWHPCIETYLNKLNSDLPGKFFTFWGPSIILGFNILWVVGLCLLSSKKYRIKIYTTLFLFIISAATLVFWLMVNALRGAMH